MSVWGHLSRIICTGLLAVVLTGCFQAPYNQFKEDKRAIRYTTSGAILGAAVGTIAGSVVGSLGAGAFIGGAAGAAIAYNQTLLPALITELQKQDIQYVKYGDTETLLVPTDTYYYFNSSKLNDLAYPGLNNIVRLLKYYSCSPIYVAGFTDNVGEKKKKKLMSQAQAEEMLTFLWANNIPAKILHAEGYADKHPIGDNNLIHGSAYNRRIEIQWTSTPCPQMAS